MRLILRYMRAYSRRITLSMFVKLLGAVTGRWALYCVDRPLRSLDFLNTVLD